MTLHVICSWCKRVLTQGDESELTSHGACDPPCREMIEAGMS